MSSCSYASHSHVAGFAWQFQQQGPPGSTSPAGAFTSPFSLYVALALALQGEHSTAFLDVMVTSWVMHASIQDAPIS